MSDSKRDYWRYADAAAYVDRVREGMPPVIICVACNGGVHGKESSAALPETADEIADSVYDAYRAGASMVHVHARDPKNLTRPAVTPDVWVNVNRKIRERCPDIIINNTTGGGPGITMEQRLSCLDAKPEVASLNLTPEMFKFKLKARKAPLPHPREEVLIDECLPWTYEIITQYATEMKKRGIKPEMETYHPGGTWVIEHLIEAGLIQKPYWTQTVMGYQTSSYPSVDNVMQILRDLPDGCIWLCSAIGPHQLPMTTLAILMGGHARVGLEDNIYFRRGEKATSNAQLVQRTARIAEDLNRGFATPKQAREMLGVSQTPSQP
jgi:3-keto-5-aminohexanoate cleavage enzyme